MKPMKPSVSKHPFQKLLVGLLNGLFFVLTLWLLFIALFRPDIFVQMVAFMEREVYVLGDWNYLLAFATSAIESFPALGVFFPGQQLMLIVGGFFGKDHIVLMIILASLGAILGNFVGYAIGLRYGKALLRDYGDTFGLGKTELAFLERQIAKNGAYFIIFGKFHNFTRSFIPFIAGSAGMRPGRFWLYNIIGSIIWAGTIITLWVLFASYYERIAENLKYAIPAIFVLVILYIAVFKRREFMKYLELKQKEIEDKNTH